MLLVPSAFEVFSAEGGFEICIRVLRSEFREEDVSGAVTTMRLPVSCVIVKVHAICPRRLLTPG